MLEKVNRPTENRIRKQTKMPKRYPPSVLVVYAKNNESDKEQLAVYFKTLELEGLIKKIKFRVIEDQESDWWLKAIKKWDVFIVMVSAHLTTHYSYKPFIARLRSEHFTHRIALVPLLIETCRIDLNHFKNLIIFPQNEQALKSDFWLSHENFYNHIFPGLIFLLKEFTDQKTTHKALWLKATRKDSITSYGLFLEQYPHSKFAGEAWKRISDLREKTLWDKFQNAETVSDYYEYLVNSSNESRYEDAALEICKIETDEDKFWEDIKEHYQFEDLLTYKMKFPKGEHIPEVNSRIEKLLLDKARPTCAPIKKSNTNFLSDMAYSNLQPGEIRAMERQIEYVKILDGKLQEELEDWTKYKMLVMPLLLPVFAGILVSDAVVFPYNRLLLIPFFYAFYRVVRSIFYQIADRRYLKKAKAGLHPLIVLFKTFLIIHNDPAKKRITRAIFKIEKQADEIKNKNFLSYILQKKKIEDFLLGK